jgi:hypothetical protein
MNKYVYYRRYWLWKLGRGGRTRLANARSVSSSFSASVQNGVKGSRNPSYEMEGSETISAELGPSHDVLWKRDPYVKTRALVVDSQSWDGEWKWCTAARRSSLIRVCDRLQGGASNTSVELANTLNNQNLSFINAKKWDQENNYL